MWPTIIYNSGAAKPVFNKPSIVSNEGRPLKNLFFKPGLNKRNFSCTTIYKIKDRSLILEELKKARYQEHFIHKNEMKDIEQSHESISYNIKNAILGLFNNTNRSRDVQNVWADTDSHNKDKFDLTLKHWELGRKCKDNTCDSDSGWASYTDSNHSRDTLNLEREREFLEVGKEKFNSINE